MKGTAILFPPYQGFYHWNPRPTNNLHMPDSPLGRVVQLERRATCRMCGKVMKVGEWAIFDMCLYDYLPRALEGYIHLKKCIPVVTWKFGWDTEQGFEEATRISTDNQIIGELFMSIDLEDARKMAVSLLNYHFNGIYPVCRIELDGEESNEPVYC